MASGSFKNQINKFLLRKLILWEEKSMGNMLKRERDFGTLGSVPPFLETITAASTFHGV